MAKCFETAITRFQADPDQAMAQYTAMSSDEKQELALMSPSILEPHATDIHYLVQRRASDYPNAQAIWAHDASYSYNELTEKSARLAQYLSDLGVKPEVFVPVCMDKSALAVITLYAVLKAGGACVPLDKNYPESRRTEIIASSRATIMLADTANICLFAHMPVRQVLVSHALVSSLPTAPAGKEETTNPQPSSAAWVVFTSGSTGKPKGIVLEHQSLAASILAHGPVLGIDAHSRVLQFAAFTFDVCIEEIFTTLAHGGCVCIPTEEDRLNDICTFMNKSKVNWADLTPSLAKLLDPMAVPYLRTLNIGGEVLDSDLIEKWASTVSLKNTYGPAECSINSTCNA